MSDPQTEALLKALGLGSTEPSPSWLSPIPTTDGLLGSLSSGVPAFSLFASPLERAVTRLVLNPTRREQIDAARSRLESIARASSILSPMHPRVFMQGSVRIGTAIRPASGDDFDADAVLLMDVRKLPLRKISPEGVLETVTERLMQIRTYAERIEVRDRCLRILYTEGFHLDIVPAHSDGEYGPATAALMIPVRGRSGWEESHPLGFAGWFNLRNRRTGGVLRKITILMKRWRYERRVQVPSILLTTMLGMFAPDGAKPLAQALAETLGNLSGELENHASPPIVPNPSLADENLGRDWSVSDYKNLRAALREAASIAATAARSKPKAAHDLWAELFGDVIP